MSHRGAGSRRPQGSRRLLRIGPEWSRPARAVGIRREDAEAAEQEMGTPTFPPHRHRKMRFCCAASKSSLGSRGKLSAPLLVLPSFSFIYRSVQLLTAASIRHILLHVVRPPHGRGQSPPQCCHGPRSWRLRCPGFRFERHLFELEGGLRRADSVRRGSRAGPRAALQQVARRSARVVVRPSRDVGPAVVASSSHGVPERRRQPAPEGGHGPGAGRLRHEVAGRG